MAGVRVSMLCVCMCVCGLALFSLSHFSSSGCLKFLWLSHTQFSRAHSFSRSVSHFVALPCTCASLSSSEAACAWVVGGCLAAALVWLWSHAGCSLSLRRLAIATLQSAVAAFIVSCAGFPLGLCLFFLLFFGCCGQISFELLL